MMFLRAFAVVFFSFFVGAGIGWAQVGEATFPTNQGIYAINPVVSTTTETSHVISTTPANLYSIYFTNTAATAGFLMVFDSATVPGDGAVTPKICVNVAANATVSVSYNPGPMSQFTTGVSAAASTTGCATKTTGATTGFFSGSVK